MKALMSFKNRFIGVVLGTLSLTIIVCFLKCEWLIKISTIVILFFFGFLIIRILWFYLDWLLHRVFHRTFNAVNKYVMGPQIVYYVIFGAIICLCIWMLVGIKTNLMIHGIDLNFLVIVSVNIASAISIFFIWNTWTNDFKYAVDPSDRTINETEIELDKGFKPIFLKDSKKRDEVFNRNKGKILNDRERFLSFMDGGKDVKIDFADLNPNKTVSYESLFNFVQEILENSVKNLQRQERRDFLRFIETNFTKKGEKVNIRSLDNRYSSWGSK